MTEIHITPHVIVRVSALLLICAFSHATLSTDDVAIATNKTFDYVIVGAGLTGVAEWRWLFRPPHRSRTDPRWNPAVYNAEERYDLNGYCNWEYPAYHKNGTALSWTIDSGACIGGSTSINGLMWYRPTEAEVNKLETLGNPGWNWANLVPYMEAIERFQPPNDIQVQQGAGYDPSGHGFDSQVNISFPTPMRMPGTVGIFKSALPQVFPGLSNDLSNRKNRRSSAANGLLWAINQQKDTLVVLANHTVDKVVFEPTEGQEPKAIGVVLAAGADFPVSTVLAGKEGIFAAGSLGSAPILERSGIGNPGILQGVGIVPVVSLPGVGVTLNDQLGTGTSVLVFEKYWTDTSIIDGRILFAPEVSLVNLDKVWGAEASTYATDLSSSSSFLARAQSLLGAGGAATLEGAQQILNTTIDLIVNSRLPVAEFIADSYPTVLFAAFWPSQPLSRGHIHINTSSPFSFPVITPRLLSDLFDQAIAVSMARKSRVLFANDAFEDVVQDPFYDPQNIGINGTDEEYLGWYEKTAYGASHWIGSTAMIPQELGGVVSTTLQVYGTRSLRIVDAGILPFQITSHTMSMLYAVAQKAAALILEDA
ncbi:glucose oxidase [Seiridium cupressi]